MSDAVQPTAAEVRAAAEAVKTALDRHLAAVERRSGDDDPAVYEAFNELAAAAQEYDELLYDRYDEVTPFEIPGSDDTLPPYTGPESRERAERADPPGLRQVVEPQRLLAQAQRVEAVEENGAAAAVGFDAASGTVHGALGVLFGEFEPDEMASRHKEFGLEEGDSTLLGHRPPTNRPIRRVAGDPLRGDRPAARGLPFRRQRGLRRATSRTTSWRTTSPRTPNWTRTGIWSRWTPIAEHRVSGILEHAVAGALSAA